MQRSLILIMGAAFSSLVLGVAGVSYAQNSATSAASTTPAEATTSPDSIPPQAVQTAPTNPGNTSQAALSPQTQSRIKNLAFNVADRLDATHGRLVHITSRLERRLDKLAATGVRIDAARADLDALEGELMRIRTTLDTLDRLIFTATTSENPRQDWPQARQVLTGSASELIAVHIALTELTLSLMDTPEPAAVTDEDTAPTS